jgi:hypothetical protein
MQLLFRAFCCEEVLLGQCERHRAQRHLLWFYSASQQKRRAKAGAVMRRIALSC